MSSMPKGSNLALTATSLRATVSWTPGPGTPDVDVSVLLLTAAGKVRSDADMVFYNQPAHVSGAAAHAGKTVTTGAARDTVTVDLARLESEVVRVVIGASADGGTFGQVPGLRLTVTDAVANVDVATFDVTDAGHETALDCGEIYRRDGAWRLRAVGQGYAGLAGLASDFGISVDDPPAQPASAASAAAAASAASAPVPPLSLTKAQKLVDMEKRVARSSPELLSLTKSAAVVLEKRGLGEHTARVALCLDISASMSRLYREKRVQLLAERVLALGLRFDDDGEIDVFLFGRRGHSVGSMTLTNFRDFTTTMLKRHPLEGATHYAAAMTLVRKHYFGSTGRRSRPLTGEVPVYCMFITDGSAGDAAQAAQQEVYSSYEPLFWQFLAIGSAARGAFTKHSQFTLLERLDTLTGRFLDNASFFAVEDPRTIREDELYAQLMTEYPGWLRDAAGPLRIRG